MELSLSPSASYSNALSGNCLVCHNFKKRPLRFGDQERFAADFAPQSINASATTCRYCAIIHKAIRQFELSEDDSFKRKIAWIYARGPAELPPRTLSLEVYFEGPRPKLELEVHNRSPSRLPFPLFIIRIQYAFFLQWISKS
jgi:hypothetical protein